MPEGMMDLTNAEWLPYASVGYELLVVGKRRLARVDLEPEYGKYEMRCVKDPSGHVVGLDYYYCDSVREAKALAETLLALRPGREE
jgi:hypothetical protein